MGFINNFVALFQKKEQPQKERKSAYGERLLIGMEYTGEKSLGEMGVAKVYKMNYTMLRARSWQAYIESKIAQTIIKKYQKWIVGAGLKLQCEPATVFLKSKGITIDESFNESVESQFAVFCKSKRSSYSGMQTLQSLAKEAFKNAKVGGDLLVVLRYVKKQLTVQLVDGCHVNMPVFQGTWIQEATARGNKIIEGIEIAPNGEHVAFYVNVDGFKYERILAKNSAGIKMAFIAYGMKYRIDEHRGVPLIAVVLETIIKLDRYESATLGSAEERQKIAFAIEHNQLNSTGENPFLKNFAAVTNVRAIQDDVPITIDGKQLEKNVISTTNKQAINMPIGSSLKMLESKNELYFKEFFEVNSNGICSAIGIPPEVAFSKYDSNFSASRAALKDWEHTIIIDREEFADDFYAPIYQAWLELSIYSGDVVIAGYIDAKINNNYNVIDSFNMAKFTGPTVPHIDPLKEVMAARLKLGDSAKNIPLTTIEMAVQSLNEGDSDSNIAQFAEEMQMAKSLGIDPIQNINKK